VTLPFEIEFGAGGRSVSVLGGDGRIRCVHRTQDPSHRTGPAAPVVKDGGADFGQALAGNNEMALGGDAADCPKKFHRNVSYIK